MDKDGFTGVKSDVETNAVLGKINNKASFSLLPFFTLLPGEYVIIFDCHGQFLTSWMVSFGQPPICLLAKQDQMRMVSYKILIRRTGILYILCSPVFCIKTRGYIYTA